MTDMVLPLHPSPTAEKNASVRPSRETGFTLIEVIASIVLLAVVSAIIVKNASQSSDQADLAGAVEVVKSHLRYAQAKAMNSSDNWGINFVPGGYTLRNGTSGATESLPSPVPSGVTISSTVNPVYFNKYWGYPSGSNNSTPTATITITVGKGASNQTITVTKNTGFIP